MSLGEPLGCLPASKTEVLRFLCFRGFGSRASGRCKAAGTWLSTAEAVEVGSRHAYYLELMQPFLVLHLAVA